MVDKRFSKHELFKLAIRKPIGESLLPHCMRKDRKLRQKNPYSFSNIWEDRGRGEPKFAKAKVFFKIYMHMDLSAKNMCVVMVRLRLGSDVHAYLEKICRLDIVFLKCSSCKSRSA